MWGCIIGDIVGSRFEFSKIRNKSKEFDLFHKDCSFTDDTILTIATIDSLLNDIGYGESYRKWANKYPDSKYSYGDRFINWALNYNKEPYCSYGNGSAMRVSPIGLYCNDMRAIIDISQESAEVTHNHMEGLKGASSVALCVYLAKNGASKKVIKEFIELFFDYDLSRPLKIIREKYSFDETCQGSVPESIICFLESTDFEDAIRNAVSLGGDTDTMACIVGGISEAYYGIPRNLIEQAKKHITEEMISILEKFYRKVY